MKAEELMNSYREHNLRIEDKSFLFTVQHLVRKHKLLKNVSKSPHFPPYQRY